MKSWSDDRRKEVTHYNQLNNKCIKTQILYQYSLLKIEFIRLSHMLETEYGSMEPQSADSYDISNIDFDSQYEFFSHTNKICTSYTSQTYPTYRQFTILTHTKKK